MNTRIITIAVVILLIVFGVLYFVPSGSDDAQDINVQEAKETEEAVTDDSIATTTEEEADTQEEAFMSESSLGQSLEGNEIIAYHYGTGTKEVLFVGGIHGGYSWNTVLLARELMNYLEADEARVPEGIRVTVIPLLNPDGLSKIVGTTGEFSSADIPENADDTIPGRFNSNEVDLNRNFDCDWQAEGVWQERAVSGGASAFSEPESNAIREYVSQNNIVGAVVWYSQAGGVFSSNCHEGILPETIELTNLYSDASGYKAYEDFDFYSITGDMVNWLAKEEVPAISVLLTNHEDVEWEKNKKGIEAILNKYAN